MIITELLTCKLVKASLIPIQSITLRHRYALMLSLLDSVMRMETERKNRGENKCAGKMEGHICCYCKGQVWTARQ